MLELYKNIKERRIKLGMTQTELAEKLGYSDKSAIAKIESGKIDIPQSKIVAFAKALHTSPSELMGWDEPKNEYYFNKETAKTAQELFDNPDMRVLFDAARDARPEDLKKAAEYLSFLKWGGRSDD